jgi:hypothetical protein
LADAWDLEELLIRAENPAKTLCCRLDWISLKYLLYRLCFDNISG